MSKLGNVIRDWADWLIAETVESDASWANPQAYLKTLTQKNAWRPAVIVVREIMRRTRTEAQSAQASLLLSDYLPATESSLAIKAIGALRRSEKEMYKRVKSPGGVERCLLLEIASSKIGQQYLASLNKKPVKSSEA